MKAVMVDLPDKESEQGLEISVGRIGQPVPFMTGDDPDPINRTYLGLSCWDGGVNCYYRNVRTGMGVYLMVNNSAPNKEGDKALLVSPTNIPANTESCFSFWYHMFGEDVGNLTVSVQSSGTTQPVWHTTGNQVKHTKVGSC